jgi:hypothetical protein
LARTLRPCLAEAFLGLLLNETNIGVGGLPEGLRRTAYLKVVSVPSFPLFSWHTLNSPMHPTFPLESVKVEKMELIQLLRDGFSGKKKQARVGLL